ncbi:D-alanine--D-alanine ligase family protein [Legionella sp. CNM-1927-20]|uniref:D-alanine--D-alanine ligase family protein n=1 Tax=Legionella sp. CNM-1927-20 TaxID=3422221 RepID=UPI00403ABF14
MSKFLNLALLYGGKSGEHEISLISAASVLSELDSNKYNIIPIGMDKEGRFYLNDYQNLLAFKESLPVITPHSKLIPNFLIDGHPAIDVDVVFPVVHGPLYEDGCLQGLLELAGIAYVGCDVLTSAIGMDKDMTRRILSTCNNIHYARYQVLSWHTNSAERQKFCEKVSNELGWPLFVKPCSLGSSVGTHKVNNLDELTSAVEDALRYDEEIIVEEYIKGREIELAVLENAKPHGAPQVSIAGEIKVHHPDGFYSYTAKYLESHQTELAVPANLNSEILNQLQTIAADIFTYLKCKGMARVDFFVNEEIGKIYFNEINTLPGFTSISMYPKLWQASGLTYSALLDQLINLAIIHQNCRKNLITNYQ